MKLYQRILNYPFFIRLLNWEYWPFNVVYGPIIPVWGWLCVRARSLFFFAAANPSIKYGGFLMESKKEIYDNMPPEFYPRTLLFAVNTSPRTVLDMVRTADLHFPLIAKPDIGGRGRGVKKLYAETELVAYATHSRLNFLVQEFCEYPEEVGIFYYRYPDLQQGVISGIVQKEFLSVIGDGKSTIKELCRGRKRTILQLKALEKEYGTGLNEVLQNGEIRELVPYGNHARGARFIDQSKLADHQLIQTINGICLRIPGFYFGRLDIKFRSWKELKEGKAFSIIEVNGAGSEPTHIYDPEHSLFFAWKEIIRHWILLWQISRQMHRKGIPYLSFKEGYKMMKDNQALDKTLASQNV